MMGEKRPLIEEEPMKKAIIFCLFCLVTTLLPVLQRDPSALAFENTLLGPRKYVRTFGEPDTYVDSFSGKAGAAVLRLQNGDTGGEKRVENSVGSATVRLNGVVVFGPEDFNKNIFSKRI